MSNSLSENNKVFLNTILNECMEQIRANALYSTEEEIKEAVENIKHLKETGIEYSEKWVENHERDRINPCYSIILK